MPAGIVHGAMPGEARAEALADFREGRVQVLTNVGVLTEGFDDPGVSCVAMARPTRSEGLYAQCVGRGTRLHPGKADCLILDFVDSADAEPVHACRRCSARRAIWICAAATPARRAARGTRSSSIAPASSSRPAP